MSDKAQAIKDDLAGVFSRAAPTYGQVGPQFFNHFGQRLVDLADLAPGFKVLDVATGRGSVLFPAVRQVGPAGHVTGIDLAEGMVRQTSAEVARLGLENVALLQMDAEHLTFEDNSFDVILCGFGVSFFPQMRQALTEFYRTLKPGGKIALSAWGTGDKRWSWLPEVGMRPKPRPGVESAVHHNSSDWLHTPLEETGFTHIQEVVEEKEFVYASEDEWWATEWSHGARKGLERLNEEQLAQTRKAASVHLQKIKQSNGFPTVFQAIFTLAVKP